MVVAMRAERCLDATVWVHSSGAGSASPVSLQRDARTARGLQNDQRASVSTRMIAASTSGTGPNVDMSRSAADFLEKHTIRLELDMAVQSTLYFCAASTCMNGTRVAIHNY
jgi:hypothetical protein